jgi:hypothetical protein
MRRCESSGFVGHLPVTAVERGDTEQFVDYLIRFLNDPQHTTPLRQRLAWLLTGALAGEIGQMLPLLVDTIQRLPFRSTVNLCGDGVGLSTEPVIVSVEDGLIYGVWLLFDPKLPYGRAFSRCRHCGDFYLGRAHPAGGPVNRVYCCPAHRAAAQPKLRTARRAATGAADNG